jgi:DNA-directed RNA polymerase subunit K/omega
MPPKKIKDDVNVKDNKDNKVTQQKQETSHNGVILATDAYDFYQNYDPSKNKTDPILNQYERAAVIGIRASQIAEGSPVLVDVPEGVEDPIKIAEMELKEKKLCMIICREGREYWRVCDLVDHNND